MANNGMITKIWGSAGWLFNHSVTFGFPLKPSEEQKDQYLVYFRALGDVLPCGYCRDSYRRFIEEDGTRLDRSVVENRESLTRWFYQLHCKVNEKLGLEYLITYPDVVQRYESFRAKCSGSVPALGCTDPLRRGFSFRRAREKDAPVIPLRYAQCAADLLEKRGYDTSQYTAFLHLVLRMGLEDNLWELVHTPLWEARNTLCVSIIQYTRENGIETLEGSGEWEGTPNVHELVLLCHLSTTMDGAGLSSALHC